MHLTEIITASVGLPTAVAYGGHLLRFFMRKLPDGVVCAMLNPPCPTDVMTIVYDPDKPDAVQHTATMVQATCARSAVDEQAV